MPETPVMHTDDISQNALETDEPEEIAEDQPTQTTTRRKRKSATE